MHQTTWAKDKGVDGSSFGAIREASLPCRVRHGRYCSSKEFLLWAQPFRTIPDDDYRVSLPTVTASRVTSCHNVYSNLILVTDAIMLSFFLFLYFRFFIKSTRNSIWSHFFVMGHGIASPINQLVTRDARISCIAQDKSIKYVCTVSTLLMDSWVMVTSVAALYRCHHDTMPLPDNTRPKMIWATSVNHFQLSALKWDFFSSCTLQASDDQRNLRLGESFGRPPNISPFFSLTYYY